MGIMNSLARLSGKVALDKMWQYLELLNLHEKGQLQLIQPG
jgi:hypothetical protein